MGPFRSDLVIRSVPVNLRSAKMLHNKRMCDTKILYNKSKCDCSVWEWRAHWSVTDKIGQRWVKLLRTRKMDE